MIKIEQTFSIMGEEIKTIQEIKLCPAYEICFVCMYAHECLTLKGNKERGKMKNIDIVTIGAFRYYLGRRTISVNAFCVYLESAMKEISWGTKKIIAKEIKECKDLGDICDKKDWDRILKLLEEDLEESKLLNISISSIGGFNQQASQKVEEELNFGAN